MILREFLCTWVDRITEVNEPGRLDPTSPLTVAVNCMECQSQHLISPFHFITQDIHLCNLCNSYSANNGSSLKTINALWNSKEIKLQQYFWYIKKTMTKKWKKKSWFLRFFFIIIFIFPEWHEHNRLENSILKKISETFVSTKSTDSDM